MVRSERVISLGTGRCTLRADPGVLTLRAEAPDEGSLRQIEQRVADRLEQGRQTRPADRELDTTARNAHD